MVGNRRAAVLADARSFSAAAISIRLDGTDVNGDGGAEENAMAYTHRRV